MSEATKAVFLSYASQDAEAAKRICDALRSAGVEVWFDQNELVGGDAWDAKIRGQISSCGLFVPIISANTQARREGYFRIEWKLAAQRTHAMADGTPFLLPLLIDGTRDTEALVPAEFRGVQWTKLPGGETSPAFCAQVKKLLGGSDVGASLDGARGRAQGTPLQRRGPSKWWLAPILGLALALALWWRAGRHDATPPAAKVPVTAVQSDAQKLVQQAQDIYAKSDELDRETLILADDLVKRALALDAAEPAAWLLGAQLSYVMVWQSFDMSEARKAELQRQAARARALAPESVPAQLAVANARVAVAYSNFQSASNRQDLAGVEQDLRALAERAPRDFQVLRTLAQTYRFLKRPDEALRTLQRALELSGGDPAVSADLVNVTLRRKRYAEAEAIMAPALARRPTGRLLAFDVFVKTRWRGDMAGAQKALAAWPGWLLREDRGAFIAWQTWLWSGQPERALDVAQRLPRDYLHDVWFTGPRAVLTARAHEMAGHRESAQADWRTVVRLVDQELAGSPDDVPAMFWKAWALSRLGDQTGAEAVCTILQQRVTTQTVFLNSTNLSLLWSTMGRTDLAAAHLRAGFGADNDTYAVTRAMLELDPAYAPLRADPHFTELAADALAPPAAMAPAASTDDKSVAVLAFANLSDDKANEYFSDGISEELLNVLAKVPGLRVTARTSSFHFKGKDTPIPEIAKQLGVAYVIEGSVRKQGDKVRITAQLIKAADGFHVWSDTFTRDLKDIFAVQDEIAGLIAKNLQSKLGVTTHPAAGVDARAFELYLQGRVAWNRRNDEGFDRAETLLRQALEIAPDFARAHAALADVWMIRAISSEKLSLYGQRASPVILPIEAEALRALELDPESAEAHATLGFLRQLQHQPAEALRLLRRSVELNPNYATGHHWLAGMLATQSLFEESFAEYRRAVAVDPLSPRILDNFGGTLATLGRLSEALALFDRALALLPDEPQALRHKVVTLARLGRRDEARALAGKLSGRHRLAVLTATGDRAELEAALPTAGRADRFELLAALGRYDEALDYFHPDDIALEDTQEWYFDPKLVPFHHDPRFRKVVTELGFDAFLARALAWQVAHPPEKPAAVK